MNLATFCDHCEEYAKVNRIPYNQGDEQMMLRAYEHARVRDLLEPMTPDHVDVMMACYFLGRDKNLR